MRKSWIRIAGAIIFLFNLALVVLNYLEKVDPLVIFVDIILSLVIFVLNILPSTNDKEKK